MSEREPNQFVWRDGIVTVPRDRVCRWYYVVDLDGKGYRWMLISDENGMRLHTSLRGAAVSPLFSNPLSMCNWLIRNDLRPKGSDAQCWQPMIAETQRRVDEQAIA